MQNKKRNLGCLGFLGFLGFLGLSGLFSKQYWATGFVAFFVFFLLVHIL